MWSGLLLEIFIIATIASPFEVWHSRSPTPTQHNLNAVAYSDGKFVAVGTFGTVVTSPNGIDWSLQSSGTPRQLNTIIFADGRFVAGGDQGTFLWSSNGLDWAVVSVPSVSNYNILALGFGKNTNFPDRGFVALASPPSATGGSRKLISPDGVTWTINNLPSHESFSSGYTSIAFGNGAFVASGYAENDRPIFTLYSLSAGFSWTTSQDAIVGPVTFANDLFVIVRGFATPTGDGILASTTTNAASWPPGSHSDAVRARSICYGGGRFVAVGGRGFTGNSADGTNWTTHHAPTDTQLLGITYGSGLYVTVGAAGVILTSPDAITWTLRSHGTGRNWNKVAAANSGFFAVGSGGNVAWSTNGSTWEFRPAPTSNALNAAIYVEKTYLAVGDSGSILLGSEPSNLVPQASGTVATLAGVAFNSGTFIVVGASGTILSSTDAAQWVIRPSGTTSDLLDITYGEGQFVAVGGNGTILTSDDGIIWTLRESPTNRRLTKIAYGNGQFAVASDSIIAGFGIAMLISDNAVTWQDLMESTRHLGFATRLTCLGYGNGYFLTANPSGRFWSSMDGMAWERHVITTNYPSPRDVVYNNDNGTFVSVGLAGVVSQSDPIVRLNVTSAETKQLTVEGPKHRTVRIEGADQLGDTNSWRERAILSWPAWTWIDPDYPTGSNRFYRAVLLP